ncbi:HesA/MoeB/ThiF family protein [Psychrobacter sp. FDAARGOS_221]|uniref:HesA/MoeB/ThiF family protein n=1 Tax=Psychrobacter sp. FDAARGOS_221 TaxID=1975705 RepID=UPI000BB56DB0|nr:HesA/MoeB/ThiF family protein [Psychrobacter sp. FDAARGOS_221]PNK61538.1 HesA/MoeB/ThiF family protein [Psychrobacter sp. FDAARGOS_221]
MSHELNLTDEELLRYSRQILLPSWDLEAQQRLKSSQVVILGAGGLGCPVSETLARAGVGAIHLIDDDHIEASNLQRQTLFTAADIGKNKAKTACQALQKINPHVQLTYAEQRLTADNAAEILLVAQAQQSSTPFLILDCTDNFAARERLNEISVQYQLPLLSASAIAMSGQLALYEPAKQSGCYHCVFGDSIASGSDEAVEDTRNCSNSGVLASTTTVMGNLQANAALQYLGLSINPLAGQLLIWDGQRMSQHKLRYRQDKQCPVCANS